MRTITLAAVLAATLGGRAAAQDASRSVLEKAVKAHGGEEKLNRLKAERSQLKGSVQVEDKLVPFVAEIAVQMPAQFKSVMHFQAQDKRFTLVQVLNGDKASVKLNGQAQAVEERTLNEMRQTMYLNRVLLLAPLLSDKAFELTSLGESKVSDRAAVGVKVSSRGRKDVRLYFDKETGLLAKTEHAVVGPDNKEVTQEEYYSDFREVSGYKRPWKLSVFRGGKKVMDAELAEIKYFDKLDDEEFVP